MRLLVLLLGLCAFAAAEPRLRRLRDAPHSSQPITPESEAKMLIDLTEAVVRANDLSKQGKIVDS